MPNLSTLLAIALMTTGLGLTACKTEPKTEPAKTEPAPVAKPAETKPTEPAPTETKPVETKPVATADLPAECADYKAGIEKLATCDKLPKESRDAMKQAFDTSSAAWANTPAEGKAALATACKTAADALKQTAAACQ
jgi:curli biogenesis system outer membrane secretion channel CsgG